jgi:hypothetical protein
MRLNERLFGVFARDVGMVKSVHHAEREVEERLDANTNEISVKAIAFHCIGDLRLEDAPEPKAQEPADATVR